MLEVKIEELTKAVIALTELIGKIEAGKTAEPVASKPSPVAAPIEPVTLVAQVTPTETVVAPVMPAAPTFEPVAAPAANAAPFTDGKGLITYVMDVYKQLGAEKGAGIQGVLTSLSYQNINDVKPEHYDALYAGIEALK
jgi:hypothetical protein